MLFLATTWALRRGMHNFYLSSFFDSSARLALDAFADVMFLALLNWKAFMWLDADSWSVIVEMLKLSVPLMKEWDTSVAMFGVMIESLYVIQICFEFLKLASTVQISL